jgi:ribonuclease Z
MKDNRLPKKNVPLAIKVLVWVLAAVLVIAGAAWIFQKPILTAIAVKTIQERFDRQSQKLDDGLYVGLAGTGAPFPDINRVGPCIVVAAGKHLYIVDCGDGAARNIPLMGFQIGRIDAILLTHFHSDHIAGLGEIMLQRWANGSNASPVDVIGPEGIDEVVKGYNDVYRLDAKYRVAHHGAATVPPSGAGGTARPFILSAGDDASTIVVDEDGVRITAFKVNHAPAYPAVGYRFDYGDRSLVISGDTVPCDSLKKQSIGVDVLLHEALQGSLMKLINEQAALAPSPSTAKITADIPSYHASPEDAARIAGEAGVKHLVLYHILPPLPPLLTGMFLGDSSKFYSGPITVGEDGMLIGLPANNDKIYFKNVLK